MVHDNNVRDLRGSRSRSDESIQTSVTRNEGLKYGKASQSPMAENVGDINLHNGAGDDTEMQTGHQFESVMPKSQRAADLNGVDWEGE